MNNNVIWIKKLLKPLSTVLAENNMRETDANYYIGHKVNEMQIMRETDANYYIGHKVNEMQIIMFDMKDEFGHWITVQKCEEAGYHWKDDKLCRLWRDEWFECEYRIDENLFKI